MKSYRMVFSSDAMNSTSTYLQHYGVKGMKWGVVNEEQPNPTSNSPKTKISPTRYQNLLDEINARAIYQPKFNAPPSTARPGHPYMPNKPVDLMNDGASIWSPEYNHNFRTAGEFFKYESYIGQIAKQFAEFLKSGGISGISSIEDKALTPYNIEHYKKELERVINESFYAYPEAVRLGRERYRHDFLRMLRRQGFDFFTTSEKVNDRFRYPSKRADIGPESIQRRLPKRPYDGSQRRSSGRNPYGSSASVIRRR